MAGDPVARALVTLDDGYLQDVPLHVGHRQPVLHLDLLDQILGLSHLVVVERVSK